MQKSKTCNIAHVKIQYQSMSCYSILNVMSYGSVVLIQYSYFIHAFITDCCRLGTDHLLGLGHGSSGFSWSQILHPLQQQQHTASGQHFNTVQPVHQPTPTMHQQASTINTSIHCLSLTFYWDSLIWLTCFLWNWYLTHLTNFKSIIYTVLCAASHWNNWCENVQDRKWDGKKSV